MIGLNINAAVHGIPAPIAIITEKIGPGHIKGYFSGFLMLDVKIPEQGDYDGSCPADTQDYAEKDKSGRSGSRSFIVVCHLAPMISGGNAL